MRGDGDVIALWLFVFFTALVLGSIFLVQRTVSDWSCSRFGDQTERQVKYDWVQNACYVKTHAGWRLRSEQRTLDNDLSE